MIRLLSASILVSALLAACGGRGDGETAPVAPAADGGRAEPLPAPSSVAGPVIGMPDAPGPGAVPLAGQPPAEVLAMDPGAMPPGEGMPPDGVAMVVAIPGLPQGDGLPPPEEEPEAGLQGAAGPPRIIVGDAPPTTPASTAPPAGASASTADAVAVVRAYYAAISAGDHGRAHALWSDAGNASGQTLQQFAAGFAGTRSIQVQPGEPRIIGDAEGASLVEVPVSVTAIDEAGREQRQVGAYVLRSAGAGRDGPGAWRITSAELRDYQP